MRQFLLRAWQAKSGLAAIEFALLAPVMIALLFGTVEVADVLTCRQKVSSVASTAADLVAQKSTITDADKTNIFNALNAIVFPYSSTGTKIRITSIVDNGTANSGKVAWSDAQNMTAYSPNAVVSVPTGLIASGGSVIMAEVTYGYTSSTAKFLMGGITMTDKFYSRPRKVAQIGRTS